MKPSFKPILVWMGVVLCIFYFSNSLCAQSKVVIPGTFQSELGCSGDWMPDCDNTALTFNSSTRLWTGSFNISKGCYQYKVAIDGNWDINYGENGLYGANLSLYVPQDGLVTFSFNAETGMVETTPFATGFSEFCLPQVVLTGDFQTELGCSNDWDATCTNTALHYVPASGQFENNFMLVPGFYEFRAILNNDWVGTNYGSNGLPSGSNYFYYTPCPQNIHFSYNPLTHIVTMVEIPADLPAAVVVAGSFQSELGCPGDWLADCGKTAMSYNALTESWTDTLDIPAGHWEYKITVNNSWDENYGQYGALNGVNIPLDLCYPAKVVFTYYNRGCYRDVYSRIITNGVCVNTFYDANASGSLDPGEEAIGSVLVTLTGDAHTETGEVINQIKTTDNDGKTAFNNIPDDFYTVKANVPSGFLPTYTNEQRVYVFSNGTTVNFPFVCLGPGGAKAKGFWISKNGEDAIVKAGLMENALSELRSLNLRNAIGTDFDPLTYEQFRSWLKAANAKNMTNMLSAEMAVMDLNRLLGYVDNYSLVQSPSCNYWGTDVFLYVYQLIGIPDYYISITGNSTGNDIDRNFFTCLKDVLEDANNNLNFVQPHPCGLSARSAVNKAQEIAESNVLAGEIRVAPNPSKNYFTLRPSNKETSKSVELKVFNIYGQQVYKANGSVTKDYRFGETFTPGIYLAEITQGNRTTTLKLVKQ
jgi:hypothetical protein